MTAKKEIESLLNRYGLSLIPLPKPACYRAYGFRDELLNKMEDARKRVEQWYGRMDDPGDAIEGYQAFIDHQSAVIELLVSALQTANKRWDELYETVNTMAENRRPYEDQWDAGYDEACSEVMEYMEELGK